MDSWQLPFGANIAAGGAVRFRIWAPLASDVAVICRSHDSSERRHPLSSAANGYYESLVEGIGPGVRYQFELDGARFPDPASRSQPDGVHGSSEVIDPAAFAWTDAAWNGVSASDLAIYELHIGAFTPAGTFDAAIDRLEHIASLGITAVELMPVASFPGSRNWGYDGVSLFAPAAVYGGPDALKRFVSAAHERGLGVILDVVYNHFGPDGNYLPAITRGRFFSARHRTPWGAAINYDGPGSSAVRDFVRQNAMYWVNEYHIDGLRLDAVHTIVDDSPVHIVREIADALHGMERPRIVIAEDERNERKLVTSARDGGYGLDAVWADDLHHELRRHTAGDAEAYFSSYTGSIHDIVETLRQGWFFDGKWSAHRGAPRGTRGSDLPPNAFIHCIQNHDQVGNRAFGDRLNCAVPAAVYRALSALLLFSPYTPLLWMGQEWAATTPFLFFTDLPPQLADAVTQGRREEFAQFSAFSDPSVRAMIPDPQAESTFLRSKLDWNEPARPANRGILHLYSEFSRLRRSEPALGNADRRHFSVSTLDASSLIVERRGTSSALMLVVSFGSGSHRLSADPRTERSWRCVLSTEEARFGGPGLSLGGDDTPHVDGPGATLWRPKSDA